MGRRSRRKREDSFDDELEQRYASTNRSQIQSHGSSGGGLEERGGGKDRKKHKTTHCVSSDSAVNPTSSPAAKSLERTPAESTGTISKNVESHVDKIERQRLKKQQRKERSKQKAQERKQQQQKQLHAGTAAASKTTSSTSKSTRESSASTNQRPKSSTTNNNRNNNNNNGLTTVKCRKGVTYTDLVVGRGPVCRDRTKIHVSYTLRKDNPTTGKVLDASNLFAFRLGRGEVIDGWDIGLQGMRQGGTRRLVVPPVAGYGHHRNVGAGVGGMLYFQITLLKC